MPDVEVIQVIRTRLARRGEGTEESPVRVVTQFWGMDGKLLAEVDPRLQDRINNVVAAWTEQYGGHWHPDDRAERLFYLIQELKSGTPAAFGATEGSVDDNAQTRPPD